VTSREAPLRGDVLELLTAPGALNALFQPIVDVSGATPKLHALEGLTRGPAGTMLEGADVLFEYVRRKGYEPLIDRICVCGALEEARAFPEGTALSLNVHLATLVRSPTFVAALAEALDRTGIPATRITLEIVEHGPACAPLALAHALDRLRASGLSIALDDVGSGSSNFKMLVDLRPDYLKIDRYIVDGITSDPYRRAVVESLLQLGARLGSRVVVEGVETEPQLTLLRSLGVRLVQGHLFAAATRASELRHHALLRRAA
jgi:EAL domain-containing protein (putative c-di-GMP-specific phosphodiesterase class I)